MLTIIILIVVASVIFDFLNGIHDSSNIVATMISSRAFRPAVALGVTAIAEFLGPFIFGVAVANTIGSEIVNTSIINPKILMASILAAIIWNLITWFFGIPSSSSHALIGGLMGAVIIGVGISAVNISGLKRVLIALFLSPIIGLIFGYLVTKLIFFLTRGATPRINWFFKRSQIITAIVLAFSHGTNDAQKTMGIITLGLLMTGYIDSFRVPFWVIALSAGAIAAGTATGGRRLIKTLGGKFFKIRPVHGFAVQIASATVILGASMAGVPVSTTQVVSSTILGVGSAERINKVRWGVARDIAIAWLVTIPASGLLAAGMYLAIMEIPILTRLF
jgi:PiT family inorganic phosphate transporter